MSKINDAGGPAFPSDYVEHERMEVGNQVEIMAKSSGMLLRDYFAAMAMQGIIAASGGCDGNPLYVEEKLSENAYAMADAMLKTREEA